MKTNMTDEEAAELQRLRRESAQRQRVAGLKAPISAILRAGEVIRLAYRGVIGNGEFSANDLQSAIDEMRTELDNLESELGKLS